VTAVVEQTYYEILGVAHNSSQQKIHANYKKLAKKHHPDMKGGDEAKFRIIAEAYGVLSNDSLRQAYDHELALKGRKVERSILTDLFGLYFKSIIGSVILIYGVLAIFISAFLGVKVKLILEFIGIVFLIGGFFFIFYFTKRRSR